jgi:hypothetical protein
VVNLLPGIQAASPGQGRTDFQQRRADIPEEGASLAEGGVGLVFLFLRDPYGVQGIDGVPECPDRLLAAILSLGVLQGGAPAGLLGGPLRSGRVPDFGGDSGWR